MREAEEAGAACDVVTIMAQHRAIWLFSLVHLLASGSVECQQYVPTSFLKNPPTDATAIKSWTFLKESMQRMGDQASDLLTIREDVGNMQSDLDSQVNLWHQAKMELMQENAGLKAEVDKMQKEVTAGAVIQARVLQARGQVEDGQHKLAQAKVSAQQLQAQYNSERGNFQKRIKELTEKLKDTRASGGRQHTTEMGDNAHLHSDGLELRAKSLELGNKLKDLQLELKREQAAAEQKTIELSGLHTALETNIHQLSEGVQAAGPLQKNVITMQAQLKEGTSEMVAAKQHYSEVSLACQQKQAESAKVLSDEQLTLKRIQQEQAEFCGPVEAKHNVYADLLAKCKKEGSPPPAASR